MSLPSAARFGTAVLRHQKARPVLSRALTTLTTPDGPGTAKRYVRIAGPSSYATRMDVEDFLHAHDVHPPNPLDPSAPSTHDLVQGQSDVFQNQAVWLYDAGSEDAAIDVANRITGRVSGMKLVRAAAVDQRVVDDMMAVPEYGRGRTPLRKRMNAIRPAVHERGRALLVTNLPYGMPARFLWSFFAAYDVTTVKHLRRSGVASIIFANENEACRALRERANLPIQTSKSPVGLKMHE